MGDVRGLIGQVLQNTYRVERIIGEGGMGAVFEASHLRLVRKFAIKLLFPAVAEHPEALARFRREAQTTSALGHPNILEVVDFNETPDGAPYIVMELLEGEDLGQRLKRVRQLDLGQAASIFAQTASALQAAHEQGVVHRDLKPQNIFLCRRAKRDDFVKLVDFGISKVFGSQSVVTQAHALLGSPCYMSPEQAEERAAEVDARTDVYAMGVILFEMLVGAPPFIGDSIPSLLLKIVSKEPPSLCEHRPDLPAELEQVVLRALSKRPEDRFASMEDFQSALSAVVDGSSVRTVMAATGPPYPGQSSSAPGPSEPSGVASAAVIPPTHHAARRTTLSSGAGEVLEQPLSGVTGRKPLALALAALLVVGLAVGLFFALRKEAPTAGTNKRAAAAATPRVERKPDTPRPATPAVTPKKVTPDASASAKAAAPDAAPASTRKLHVMSKPAGAQVFVAGRAIGTTPIRGEPVAKGAFVVLLKKRGYASAKRRVRAGSNAAKLRVSLRPLPASLSVVALFKAKSIRATIYLDGKKVDQAPTQLTGLSPGKHTIWLTSPGYRRSTTRRLTLRPGESKRVLVGMRR